MSNLPKKTPLYEEHVRLSARLVDFAGWLMPVQYEGLKEEHAYTRQHIGLFDVSHMGEIRVKGPRSIETLQWLTTNDIAALSSGQAHYSLLPNEKGGLVDDIFVYCLERGTDYLVCVNASNADKDFAWMLKNNRGADITNESAQWGQIAVQGPEAMQLCDAVLGQIQDGTKASSLERNQIRMGRFHDFNIMVATTGYTGEKGCEIFIETAGCAQLWQSLLQHRLEGGGQAKPIGLGARDTLRTEMKYSLYGHEIDDLTNPYEAGLGWVIKPNAKDFIGKTQIMQTKTAGLTRKLVGFKMLERGIPRQGYALLDKTGKKIGVTTSGTHSPTLDEPIGIGYVEAAFAVEGTEIFVDIRGKPVKACTAKTPFVDRG